MRYLLLLLLLVGVPGCSAIQFGGTTEEAPKVPSKPVYEQPEMKIGKQQLVDVLVQLGNKADATGIGANTQESKVLLDSTLLLQVIEGVPVDQINWEDEDAVADLHADIRELEREYRKKVAEWEALIKLMAEDEDKLVELSEANSSLWTWLTVLGVSLGLLCILCPTIGVPLVVWLIKRAKATVSKVGEAGLEMAKDQFGQVVTAIEDTKAKIKEKDIELYNHLMANLRKSTDQKTRDTINELKNKVHR